MVWPLGQKLCVARRNGRKMRGGPRLVVAPGRKGLMVCFLQLLLLEQNRVEIVKSVRENCRIPRGSLIAGIVLGPAERVVNRRHLALALKWFPEPRQPAFFGPDPKTSFHRADDRKLKVQIQGYEAVDLPIWE